MENFFVKVYNSLILKESFDLKKKEITDLGLDKNKKVDIDVYDGDHFICNHKTNGNKTAYEELTDVILDLSKKKINNLKVKIKQVDTAKKLDPDNELNLRLLYNALSNPPNPLKGHDLNLDELYGKTVARTGKFPFTSKFSGDIPIDEKKPEKTKRTNRFHIAYTTFNWEEKDGPVALILHGVPTNRRQAYPIAKLLAKFTRVVTMDLLGMGESSKPKNYGVKQNKDLSAWDWVHDTVYIRKMMEKEFEIDFYRGEKFIFIADDWGGGILAHYCARYPDDVSIQILVDPIAFDGYPVNEIQAIGRLAGIFMITNQDKKWVKEHTSHRIDHKELELLRKNIEKGTSMSTKLDETKKKNIEDSFWDKLHGKKRKMFRSMVGGFDQTLVQIYKTMVYDPNVYNQYNLRDITFPYVDVDYERLGASSMTMGLKYHNIRVLAERASRLSPDLLLPYDIEKNPKGVNYLRIEATTIVIWGLQDNMMPALQRFRFQQAMRNAKVHTCGIVGGHFISTDKPKEVAETILSFLIAELGVKNFQPFMGFKGIFKGDEHEAIRTLKKIKVFFG